MSVIKNETANTLEVRTRYTDWTGARKQKTKRGFIRKADAVEWEQNFQLKASQNVDMTANCATDRTVLRSKTDAEQSERTL